MAQGFYTLDEAASVLKMTPEELNRMAQKREIRAFADRGTWRFRTQDIDDLAQQRAAGGGKAKSADEDEGIFGFSLDPDENIEIGQEILPKSGSRSGPRSGPRSKPGSDVRLAVDDEFNLQLTDEGDDLPGLSSGTRRKSGLQGGGSGSGKHKRRTGFVAPPRQDSGARLPGQEGGDSDVRLDFDVPAGASDSMVNVGQQVPPLPGDSDVRLDPSGGPPKTGLRQTQPPPADDESLVTEEIDLDAEMPPAKSKSKLKPKSKVKPKTKPPELPTVSPFELSESDLDMPGMEEDKSNDSDFDLSLDADESGDLQLGVKEDDGDSVELGGPLKGDARQQAGLSGVNLQAGADTGMDADSSVDSDFDLSIDADDEGASADSSDFELTIDEEEATAAEASEEEKDIFETDFELPALDEESASEAVALEEGDTDLESSDFELSLDEDSLVEESTSEVLDLEADEEEPKPRKKRAPVDEDDFSSGSLDALLGDESFADIEAEVEEEDEEEEEEDEVVGAAAAAPPANWGILPTALLVPCVIVMILVGLMGFELLHGMWGYQQPNKTSSPLLRGIAGLFTDDLPKD
jgi:excisionase family DNA binding protein